MNDLIERRAAIYALANFIIPHDNGDGTMTVGVLSKSSITDILNDLPSAQLQLPEWAQKVEEYRKSAPSHIHNPLAWALYQTWKEYDIGAVNVVQI